MRAFTCLLAVLAVHAIPADCETGPRPVPVARADDGRAGVVLDAQGSAQVRPVGHRRWTPLQARARLVAGDLVRTGARGANAVEIGLAAGGRVLVGPRARVEVVGGGEVRVLEGDVEVQPAAGAAVLVRGPGGFERRLAARAVVRGRDSGTAVVDADPPWLVGYRSSTTDEWMGSLVAEVDGRAVPLAVGEHHVTVEIRDQIARTTVEQTFVNGTDSRLEGTFFFPLPADASISGFGMWIGGELVEADIVEKQRARRIFEDILRRRKDPALLEWAGGNLFKARVFPIEAHSEKRVMLRYTQVLPLTGDELRYRYALRSELLRSRPLRELDLRVTVASSVPILAAESPTHEVRAQHTANAARVEYDARDVSPQRDFEVRLRLDGSRPLTVVPHRRGDDGYFAVLLSLPDENAGPFRRRLLADGRPLHLVVLADTSASMDAAARTRQAAFVDALLGGLGDGDSFQLWSCDVRAQQLAATTATDADAIAGAMAALASRPSLGWTDLRAAVTAVAGASPDGATVVYVGDGIVTAHGDSDPMALAQWLRERQVGGRSFHAVAVGSTFEQPVLDALATIGDGGSARALDAEPANAAFDLLSELVQPPLRGLQLRFEGLRTARVYPLALPNLAAGRQHIVLGRYLPGGSAQRGRVVVQGQRDGAAVEFAAEVELPAEDAGNSFLPRLWARRHVDALLAQGRTAAVESDVIALSEQYHILTPLTSLLVLENDEDRERYGVARRVHMRDGERFFADGSAAADRELMQQQMQAARTWRLGLRARMLAEISDLGESLYGFHVGLGGVRHYPLGSASEMGAGLRDVFGQTGYTGGEKDDDLRDAEAPADEPFADDADGDEAEPPAEPAVEEQSLRREQAQERLVALPASRAVRFDGRDSFFAQSKSANWRGQGPVWTPVQFGFPQLPDPVPAVAPPDWPEEVAAVLRDLDPLPALLRADGVRIDVQRMAVDPLTGGVVGRSWTRLLLAGGGWLRSDQGAGGATQVQWVFDGVRGIANRAFGLGRTRPAVDGEKDDVELPLPTTAAWQKSRWQGWTAAVTARAGDTWTLTFTPPAPQTGRQELVVDVARRAIVETRWLVDGKLQRSERFSGFVTVRGYGFATEMVTLDGDGRPVARASQQPIEVATDVAAPLLAAHRQEVEGLVLLPARDPDLSAARQAVHDGDARIEHHLALVLAHASAQRWDRAWDGFAALERSVGERRGLPWMRAALLAWSRRGEELERTLPAMGAAVTAAPSTEALFLVATLMGHASSLHVDERRHLLDELEPMLRGPSRDGEARTVQRLRWRADALSAAGRHAEAAGYREQIWAQPGARGHDAVAWMRALQAAGDVDAALRVAQQVLASGRLDAASYDTGTVYDAWTDLLWDRRDADGLVAVATRWAEAQPESDNAQQRRLSAWMLAGREADAETWMRAVFDEPLVSGDAARAQSARLRASVQLALGNGWNFHTWQRDERYDDALARLGRRLCAADAPQVHVLQQLLGHWQFLNSGDAAATVRAAVVAALAEDDAIAGMSAARLQVLAACGAWQREAVDEGVWRAIVDALSRRLLAATRIERSGVWSALTTVCDQHGEGGRLLPLLRDWLALAEDSERPQVARMLFDRLLQQDWSLEVEAELLALLPRLHAPTDDDAVRRSAAAATVRQLVAGLYGTRLRHRLGDVAELERLPRAERRLRERTARREVRLALAEALAAAASAAEEQPWLQVEALCLRARGGEEPARIDGEARELLASAPAAGDDPTARLLRERCALLMAYAASRRQAAPVLADAALELLARRSEAAPDLLDWRYHSFRLLVALDRAQQLEAALRAWQAADSVDNTWRVALAFVLAERGDLREAAAALEAADAIADLSAVQLRTLAQWYLAMGDEPARQRAQGRRYAAMAEHELAALVQRWRQRAGQSTTALEPEVFDALTALLARASNPTGHTWLVQQLYDATKDFRVLACWADALVGHSPQGIYPMLTAAWQTLRGVHEEATCDELRQRIEQRLATAVAVDRRALRLLLCVVERRAAEVLNQPGEHAARALAALRTAFDEPLRPGEPVLVAELLAAAGRIPDAALAAEQRQRLAALHAAADPTEYDGLRIAIARCNVDWVYGDRDRALDGLVAAVDALRQARSGVLGPDANAAVDLLVAWWTQVERYASAEELLRAELAAQALPSQQAWLFGHLHRLYAACLAGGGTLSIGSGATLYRSARAAMQDRMFVGGAAELSASFDSFLVLHRAARGAKLDGVVDDMRGFCRDVLFELVTRDLNEAARMVDGAATLLAELGDVASGVDLMLTWLEREPAWLARVGRGGWQRFAGNLGNWRAAGAVRGALAERLLTQVVAELRRDLRSGQARNRVMYNRGGWFWAEHEATFAGIADEIAAEKARSSATQLYVADYLWGDLQRYEHAITVLAAAAERGVLRADARFRLVGWLQNQRRWAESLPLVAQLIADEPDELAYRMAEVVGLHHTDRQVDAGTRLDEAVARWRKQDRFTEPAMATVAATAAQCGLWQRTVAMYQELIPLHQRTRTSRGVGDGTLPSYYGNLAQALAALGRHDEAVDAAAAGVVAWGRSIDDQRTALEGVRRALREIDDLAGYVARHDARVAASGADAPVIRLALAAVLAEREQWADAEAQVLRARELQPLDPEVHALLVRVADARGDTAAAIAAVRGWLAAFPLELERYADLGRRLDATGAADEGERAWTSTVEVLPEEAEGHRLLAVHRREAGNFAEAVRHWQRVTELRSEEPDGWLELARDQLAAGQRDLARRTVDHLLHTRWEERFGDVRARALGLMPPR